MLLFLIVGLLFEISSAHVEEYLLVSQIQERLENLGTRLNELKREGLTFTTMEIGQSYQKKRIIAYCFGNCNKQSPSVILLFTVLYVVSTYWRNSWARGLFGYGVFDPHFIPCGQNCFW